MFRKILASTTFRILLGFAAIMGPVMGFYALMAALLPATLLSGAGVQTGLIAFGSLLGFLCYILLYRWLEKRRMSELALRAMLPHLAFGLLIGAVLISLTVGVVALAGQVRITAINPLTAMIPALAMALQSSTLEELLFRGVLMRLLNARFGSLPALIVSALIFGGVHKMNPDATWLSALAVAIEAGLLLGLAFLASGTLWLPIGIHFAWNFVQAGVFSLSVSGFGLPDGLLSTTVSGPLWATGGAFGVEQSGQAVAFCLIASAGLYRVAKVRGRVLKARWRR